MIPRRCSRWLVVGRRSSLVGARLAIALIRLYQVLISPWLPPACRFWPTCSRFACAAIARYGLRRGAWLSLRRLARCHPFHPGGYDPVT